MKKAVDYNKLALALHKKLKGKLAVQSKVKLKSKTDWSTMYTPGVGAVSAYLAKYPEKTREYTMKNNLVAVVSDGSAVLGLGDIGPEASLPVMEGKAAIFNSLAGVDAVPIVLDVHTADEIVAAVKAIAPSFGGINLEDIAAPVCFEVEERLKKDLTIPVMHDDQHGTAIVVLAGLINAAKVVKKNLKKMKVVIVGAGAAGRATALLLLKAGVGNVIVTDRQGAIVAGRPGLSGYKKDLAKVTNSRKVKGDVLEAVEGADVLIGVSGPGTITKHHVEMMNDKPVVFALANPVPEILPKDAKQAGACVIATGRSDYPNQVNNSLVFPGIFRGALDKKLTAITDETKIRAAKAVAGLVKKPSPSEIIPSVNHPDLVKVVARAVK
tara:strand:- start:4125 stop:5270 length:1146 start_codon:yes stop_codon:yes gene_type:complete